MPAKKPLPREADGTVDIKAARKRMKGHRTNAEIEARAKTEVKAPPPARVKVPAYLPQSMKAEYRLLARKLIKLQIFCDLDSDMLARYLIVRAAWLNAQVQANRALSTCDQEAAVGWGKLAKGYFGQCQSCAAALGLSITSRCRLVMPAAPEDEAAEDPMTKMLRERAERRKA